MGAAFLTAALVLALVAWAAGAGGGDEPIDERHVFRNESRSERVAVIWEGIHLSADRRTLTVTTSFPSGAFCVKEADGVDVEVEGDVAVVAAWMRGPGRLPEGFVCTSECGMVTQSVTLAEPLPEEVQRFEPVDHALGGCW